VALHPPGVVEHYTRKVTEVPNRFQPSHKRGREADAAASDCVARLARLRAFAPGLRKQL